MQLLHFYNFHDFCLSFFAIVIVVDDCFLSFSSRLISLLGCRTLKLNI